MAFRYRNRGSRAGRRPISVLVPARLRGREGAGHARSGVGGRPALRYHDTMLSFEDALRTILDHIPPPEPEETLLSLAAGRALAADVRADRDSPPFDSSAMDGYAVRASDAAAGAILRVTEEILAGRMPTRPVGSGEAAAVMTGAPVPDGADAVVKVEDTEVVEGGVRLARAATPGDHIRLQGENRRAGEIVLAAGTGIGPVEIGVLATVGLATVPVFRRPTLAVVATGDELVAVEDEPGPARIRNANSSTLLAQGHDAGARTLDLGRVEDEPAATRRAIRDGLESDVLVLSGGVSMGTRDLVAEALVDEGVEILFHRVRIKPGKPLLFGRRGKTLVFGVPGNPVSTFVTFELFVRPAIRARAGFRRTVRPVVPAVLAEDTPAGVRRRLFAPAILRPGAAGWQVAPVPWRGSGDAFGLAGANALLIYPEDVGARAAGTLVDVVPLTGALRCEAS